MSPNQKNESGTNCWLTGLIKSAAVFSNEGNMKMFYNLEGIQQRPWRRFDQFYEVFSPDN